MSLVRVVLGLREGRRHGNRPPSFVIVVVPQFWQPPDRGYNIRQMHEPVAQRPTLSSYDGKREPCRLDKSSDKQRSEVFNSGNAICEISIFTEFPVGYAGFV